MLFTSLEFVFVFLPVVFLVHLLLRKQFRNYWLMICSLFFYAWSEPVFVFVMLFQVLLSYVCALWMDRCDKAETKKRILVLAILGNLSVLFVCKYLNFFVSVLLAGVPVLNRWLHQTHVVLPIGISFFTFQALSYVIDVYRGDRVQRNLGSLCLYVSFFPQLIAGPIVRYRSVAAQIEQRTVFLDKVYEGLKRFLVGFNKKVLFANLFAIVADRAFEMKELSVAMAWLGALCYSLQIYFDFGGYSDMAIGLGKMFGFEFAENFNYPYISKSISEFWRRWHISLGSWFKDYVYFPLGGSRVKTKTRLIFNLMVVWCATGIWHGASWNFIVWGVFYGVLITFEKLVDITGCTQRSKVLGAVYQFLTLLLVMMGWVVFRAVDLESALSYLSIMFGQSGAALMCSDAIRTIQNDGLLIVLGMIGSTPFIKWAASVLSLRNKKMRSLVDLMGFVLQFVLLLASVSYLVMNAHNPFIYFNF